MKKIIGMLFMVFLLCVMVSSASALSVLGTTQNLGSYGYGVGDWGNMTAALNTATSNQFDTVPNFENLSQMLTYDALWLDCRNTSLTATEYNNIQSFIATGRRVVMIGENSSWTAWNQQIVGMNGGTYGGQEVSGTASSVISNALTNGAPSVYLPTAGVVASGGTALYVPNFATLWGNNVLTVLDVNIFSNTFWGSENNGIFATNVANWVAGSSGPTPVQPIPTLNEWGMILLSLAMAGAGLVYMKRRRQDAM
ncbi:MAG: IPTL-CTERM sorting domain-containing protein [Desulfobacteraceae bacterium]|nr:MAG: IPTL-CTERM sorting domain-containing protein [Desulfobacteraceae bacterium]